MVVARLQSFILQSNLTMGDIFLEVVVIEVMWMGM
jgi:hypothetical protein